MGQSESGLPSYKNPPVGEVSLTVQFQKLGKLRSLEMAEFRALLDGFPVSQEQPLIPAMYEQLPGARPVMQSVEIQLLDIPPPPRYLFISHSNDELIQLQQDRFGYNWRKIDSSQQYPRYETIVARFSAHLELFCKFLADKQLGQFIPTQCDITYSNQIHQGDGWERFSEINKVMNLETIHYSNGFLSEPEAVEHVERHIIDLEGKPVGRLHVKAEPAFDLRVRKPILRLTLTARGKPLGSGIDGILKFMNLGRIWIVKAFGACIKPEMQELWGRLDGAKS